MRGCGCGLPALITRGGRGAAWTGVRHQSRWGCCLWRGSWQGLRAAAGACVESGQAGLETGPQGGCTHLSPLRGVPVVGGRPAGFAGVLGRFCPLPCLTGGWEGGKPVQGETEGPPCWGLGHLAKTVGSDSQPRMAAQGHLVAVSASVHSGRLLSPPAVGAARLWHHSLLPPRWSLSTRCPWSWSPLPVHLPPWTLAAGRGGVGLEVPAGGPHRSGASLLNGEAGCGRWSSIQEAPPGVAGPEGPATGRPRDTAGRGLTSRKRSALPSGRGGGRWPPSHPGVRLELDARSAGQGTSTEEVASWWAQCSWDLGAGDRG